MAKANEATNSAGPSQEDIERGLKLLQQQREQRAKAKERGQSPEQKAKSAAIALRARVRQKLMIQKAMAAGIIVSDAEVSEHIANNPSGN